MKRLSLIIIIILFTNHCFSQGEASIIDENVNPAGVIDEVLLPSPKLEGSFYLTDEWLIGSVILTNNQNIKGYRLKYDLKNNYLEINVGSEIKICPLKKIKSFEYLNFPKNYINTTNFSKLSNKLPNGIAELLFDDKVTLINHQFIEIKDPTYVPTVNMGQRNKKIVQREQLYLISNSKLFKLKGKLKRNTQVFGDHSSKVSAFANDNRLTFKDINEATQIIKFYNSLLE